MLMRSPTRWARPKLVRPPGFILPCQPVLATKVPVGEGWLHELKHDGFRILAHKDGERVHLWSRNGRDRSRDFVAMANAVRALPTSKASSRSASPPATSRAHASRGRRSTAAFPPGRARTGVPGKGCQ